jgi:hypothetical protein
LFRLREEAAVKGKEETAPEDWKEEEESMGEDDEEEDKRKEEEIETSPSQLTEVSRGLGFMRSADRDRSGD